MSKCDDAAKNKADVDTMVEKIVACSQPGSHTLVRAYCKYLIAAARLVQLDRDAKTFERTFS